MALRPTPVQVAELKRLVSGIIRAQGNRFIKEILRTKNIRIGATKDDFERNLIAAIEAGELNQEDLTKWLESVEGWGNQHVYLYKLSRPLLRELTARNIRRRVVDSGLERVWNGQTLLSFPDEPTLTSISFTNSVLRIVWQEATPNWTAAPEKNYTEEEGLDTFEYRAFRMVEHRAINRFEARVDVGLAGLFIADPIQGDAHHTALNEVKRVVGLLMDLRELERQQVDISVVTRNLDQRNVANNIAGTVAEVKTQKSRLASGGAYVEFAASSRDRAYWEEPAIQNVRASVRNQQLPAFQGSEGVFIFQPDNQATRLDRPLRVQLYGRDKRVRLWAQMDKEEVWSILRRLGTYE